MSGVLAVKEWNTTTLRTDDVARMMRAMSRRGDRTALWEGDGVAVGTARFEWELRDGFSGNAGIVRRDHLVVAADATLYYRRDLAKKLEAARVSVASLTPSDLILAAYEAWGEDSVDYIEGDYAFVVYDAKASRVMAARDPMGRRPLFFATFGSSIVVSSTAAAILAHPRASSEPSLAALVSRIAFGLTDDTSSPYSAVSTLPAGHRLVSEGGRPPRVASYWSIPAEAQNGASFEDAVGDLRELVASAVIERMDPARPTTIWLSGGYDSTAIYGIAERALRERRDDRRLAPVSMSYPMGDQAREDELIEEVAGFWNATPRWVRIQDVPLLANLAERAAGQDEPFPHAFENWTHAMLAETRASSSHVAMTGDGGDQLFAVSDVFMLDLLARGQWAELRREWNAFGPRGYRAFARDVVRPVIKSVATRLRRDRTPEFRPPTWIRPQLVESSGFLDREFEAERDLASKAGSHERTETLRPLLSPITARVAGCVSNFALDYGVEVRSPLLDRRVIDFAARRPRRERASAGCVKHLLRGAAAGAVPSNVLAPRSSRTGTLGKYFARDFAADQYGIVTDAFRDPILAQLGVIEQSRLSDAWTQYRSGGDATLGFSLFLTLQVELWLRGQSKAAGRDCTQLAEVNRETGARVAGTRDSIAFHRRLSQSLRPTLPLRPSWP